MFAESGSDAVTVKAIGVVGSTLRLGGAATTGSWSTESEAVLSGGSWIRVHRQRVGEGRGDREAERAADVSGGALCGELTIGPRWRAIRTRRPMCGSGAAPEGGVETVMCVVAVVLSPFVLLARNVTSCVPTSAATGVQLKAPVSVAPSAATRITVVSVPERAFAAVNTTVYVPAMPSAGCHA